MSDSRWVVVRIIRRTNPNVFDSKIVGIAKSEARAAEILGDQPETQHVSRYAILEVPEK